MYCIQCMYVYIQMNQAHAVAAMAAAQAGGSPTAGMYVCSVGTKGKDSSRWTMPVDYSSFCLSVYVSTGLHHGGNMYSLLRWVIH